MPTVLVTGTDTGLGRAFLECFLARGFRVFAASHRLALRGEAVREVSPALTELPLEVTDPTSVRSLVDSVAVRTSTLDVLVNNAAVNPEKDALLEELDLELVRRVLDVNALGPLRMTQACLPLLSRSETRTVVNVSSEAGSLTTCTRHLWLGYCMSKAALNMQTRILRNQLGRRGLRVVAVHPGWLRTPMASFEGPLAPEESAESIARLILEPGRETPEFFQHDGSSHPW